MPGCYLSVIQGGSPTCTVGANIMFPCEVRSVQTSPEVRTKLRPGSYEVVQ